MKKAILISVLSLLFHTNANAQEKKDDLKKLFKLINSEKMMEGISTNIIASIKANAKINSNDGEKNKFENYMGFVTDEMKEMMKQMNEDLILIYDKHFTDKEVKDLVAFYESESGKKFIEKTPEISGEFMSLMMTKYMPPFQEKIKAKMGE